MSDVHKRKLQDLQENKDIDTKISKSKKSVKKMSDKPRKKKKQEPKKKPKRIKQFDDDASSYEDDPDDPETDHVGKDDDNEDKNDEDSSISSSSSTSSSSTSLSSSTPSSSRIKLPFEYSKSSWSKLTKKTQKQAKQFESRWKQEQRLLINKAIEKVKKKRTLESKIKKLQHSIDEINESLVETIQNDVCLFTQADVENDKTFNKSKKDSHDVHDEVLERFSKSSESMRVKAYQRLFIKNRSLNAKIHSQVDEIRSAYLQSVSKYNKDPHSTYWLNHHNKLCRVPVRVMKEILLPFLFLSETCKLSSVCKPFIDFGTEPFKKAMIKTMAVIPYWENRKSPFVPKFGPGTNRLFDFPLPSKVKHLWLGGVALYEHYNQYKYGLHHLCRGKELLNLSESKHHQQPLVAGQAGPTIDEIIHDVKAKTQLEKKMTEELEQRIEDWHSKQDPPLFLKRSFPICFTIVNPSTYVSALPKRSKENEFEYLNQFRQILERVRQIWDELLQRRKLKVNRMLKKQLKRKKQGNINWVLGLGGCEHLLNRNDNKAVDNVENKVEKLDEGKHDDIDDEKDECNNDNDDDNDDDDAEQKVNDIDKENDDTNMDETQRRLRRQYPLLALQFLGFQTWLKEMHLRHVFAESQFRCPR